ncbi:MAG: (Fe-S)-binding protein [Burkholderiaceae bacterium]|nr:(Fe-S)-binding protein [Burkholderiaceae bacterium]
MRVGLFVTCLIDLVRPEIGFSVVKLLENAGCAVEVPEQQTCCGQPAYNSGDSGTARGLAEQVLKAFEGYDYVVVASGSCGSSIKGDYVDLFRDDPDLRARFDALAAKTYELTDFLVNVCKVETLDSRFVGRITYHDSCSGLRYLGVQAQPRKLLAMVPGVQLTEMEKAEQCCGFGGTFSVKYGDISSAIVSEKCQHIQACGADAVVLGDLGCMMNIEGRLRRSGDEKTRVLHIAQVLTGDA